MSRTAARRARVAASLDRHLGQRTLVTPLLTGGAIIGGPDPANPPYELVGIYLNSPTVEQARGASSTQGDKVRAQGAQHSVSYAIEALGTNPRPRPGWHCTLLDLPGQPAFRFTPADDGPQGRLTFNLVPLGKGHA